MPNDNTHTRKWLTVDELSNFIRIVDGNHDKGAGAIAEELLPMIEARLPRTPAEPKAGDWEQGLDQLHDALGLLKLGDHPDKVFGEYVFPLFRALSSSAIATTNDVSTSDRLVDAPRITEQDITDAMLRADFADKPDSEGNMEHFTRFVSASTRRAMAEYLSGRVPHAPLSGITGDSDKSDLPIANSVQLSEEMVERIEDALHQIDQWAKAYPEDIFPKPDLKKANRLLTEGGVSFSALNAYSMNHVIQRVKGIIDGSGIRDLLHQPPPFTPTQTEEPDAEQTISAPTSRH